MESCRIKESLYYIHWVLKPQKGGRKPEPLPFQEQWNDPASVPICQLWDFNIKFPWDRVPCSHGVWHSPGKESQTQEQVTQVWAEWRCAWRQLCFFIPKSLHCSLFSRSECEGWNRSQHLFLLSHLSLGYQTHCTIPKGKLFSLCTLGSSGWSIIPKAETPSGSPRQAEICMTLTASIPKQSGTPKTYVLPESDISTLLQRK